MDKKTYEYMAERTEKYKELENEKKDIEEDRKHLIDNSIICIKTSSWTMSIPKELRAVLTAHTIEAIDERLMQIEKEMEEI